ncbi:MAG TPA: excinuclease ABC subunit UvrB [bacterium]|nr:excinuclease ABC subunit UvrB [bacterium]
MSSFDLVSEFEPTGDQPEAIDALVSRVETGAKDSVLLGVTGSGKTFTIANVIQRVNLPTLVLSHNKTLAAQLYTEFKQFFPSNAVEYFVSYYDYYQPEAYLPVTDTYIKKDADINEEIDRLRYSATRSLFERRDVIIVASVSCIYGLGSPEAYFDMILLLDRGKCYDRDAVLERLVKMHYKRNDTTLVRGAFRARGGVIEVFPVYESRAIRIELYGDEVERITFFDPLTGHVLSHADRLAVYAGSHYVVQPERVERGLETIMEELEERLDYFEREGKLLEAERLRSRTLYDLEMIREVGYCSGIENYSRHFTGRRPGEPPPTLLDFFPSDFLLVIDESHATVPQLRAMCRGDRSRKETLVQYGFRLPSAFDNRPLFFEEFNERRGPSIYVSATPADYELGLVGGEIVEQVVRPTGLCDPEVELQPAVEQIDHLLGEIKERVDREQRVLVTALTKRMAEDLTDYYCELGVRARYLHSEVKTLQRTEIIRELRQGEFDVLIGINLLREGLDLPEVSLVAILDADKEGFLRSRTSLIQTMGRAARNVDGKVILYADKLTDSIRAAVNETSRRRRKQLEYNQEHGITPQTIQKRISEPMSAVYEADYYTIPIFKPDEREFGLKSDQEQATYMKDLEQEMVQAAEKLEFERAAKLRDKLLALRKRHSKVLPKKSNVRSQTLG